MSDPWGIDDLAAGLFWGASEKVLVVWVYYDESGEYDAAGNLLNMTIGGCVSTLPKWQEFAAAWRRILDTEHLDAFHMTDFEAWRSPFDFKKPDGSRDYERHNRLLNSLLDAMFASVEGLYGFAAIRLDSYQKGCTHKLMLEDCVVGAVTHAVHDVWERYKRPVNLVFARQKHFPGSEIKKYIWLYDYGEGKGRVKTESMANAEDLPPLQAADILAYEMSRAQRRGRPERYPLKRMIEHAKLTGTPMILKWGPVQSRTVALSR